MSEPLNEESKKIIKSPDEFHNFIQSKEGTRFTGVFELTKDLFSKDESEYQRIILNLLNEKEVFRIPIIGFKKDEKVFCLATNERRQEHRELMANLEKLGYKVEDISFSTSIELGGTGRYILDFNHKSDSSKKILVTLGRGSDVFSPQFTDKGMKIIGNIFDAKIIQI